jgi:hypothetical protein
MPSIYEATDTSQEDGDGGCSPAALAFRRRSALSKSWCLEGYLASLGWI